MNLDKRIDLLEQRVNWLEGNYVPDVPDEQFESEEDETEIDYQERRECEEDELVSRCSCGAYRFSGKGVFIQVADCCCGAG